MIEDEQTEQINSYIPSPMGLVSDINSNNIS